MKQRGLRGINIHAHVCVCVCVCVKARVKKSMFAKNWNFFTFIWKDDIALVGQE